MHAERFPSTWPLALNLIGPPIIMRSLISVRRTASVSASALVGRARVKAQLVFGILLAEYPAHRLGERRLGIEPGHIGDTAVGQFAEGLEKLILVHARRARTDDAHDIPTLLENF